MLTLVVIVQVVAAVVIIGLVLLQHGKGADMGASFGSGASGSLFGASGSSNFLSKSTGLAAIIFFCATLALAFFGGRSGGSGTGVMDQLPAQKSAVQASASAASASAATASSPANQIPK